MTKCRAQLALFLSIVLVSAHLPTQAFSQAPAAGVVSAGQVNQARQVLHEAIRAAVQQNPSLGQVTSDRAVLNGVYQSVSQRPEMARPIMEAAKSIRPDLSNIIERVGQRALTNTVGYASATGVPVSTAASTATVATTASVVSAPLVVGGVAVAAAAGVAVAAAGGGGSGSGGASSGSGALEYAGQSGLLQIDAAAAYARGATGAGVTVAVLDTGVDVTHPDLDDNIAAAGGYNAVEDNNDVRDIEGHGTHVAGIIAAEKDYGTWPFNMHGVAYDAKILPVQIFEIDSISGNAYTYTPYIIDGIDYAISQGAQVANNSYGYIYSDPSVTEQTVDTFDAMAAAAYQDAVDSGMILVFSAGNNYEYNPTIAANASSYALFPYIRPANASSGVYDDGGANYDFSALEGMYIAVVATNESTGQIASFSNRCGVAAAWCIAAPGNPINSLNDGGGYIGLSGTSMAAPHVSGAVAVLIDMFPELTQEEIVQRLFASANKTGVYANQAIYGQGFLDLEAATRPLGILSVSTGASVYTGSSFPLSGSSLHLGAAFGDGLASSLSGRSMAVFDSQKATFFVNLGQFAQTANSSMDMDGALRRFRSRFGAETLQVGDGTLTYALVDLGRHDAVQQDPSLDDGSAVMELSYSQNLGDMRLDMQYNISPSAMLGLYRSEGIDSNMMISRDALTVPYAAFARQGYSMGSHMKLNDSFSIGASAFKGHPLADEDLPDEDRAESFGNVIEVAYHSGALKLFSQTGMLAERKTLLGSRTDGAFGTDSGGYTGFAGFNAAYGISDRWNLVGSYYSGYTEPKLDSSSLFSDMSNLRSEAFSLGFLGKSVLKKGDQFGFIGNQPLRVSGGSANLSVATGRSQSGMLYTQDYAVNLAPTGRELNLELFYHYNLSGSDTRLMSSLMYRSEPGHIETAPDEGVLLMQVQQLF